MLCLKFSLFVFELDWFQVSKSSRIYLLEFTFVNTWREKWVWEEIMIIGVLWVTHFYWRRPPCTYHCRPHAHIIGDPHGRIIGDHLILVGDPRFHWRPQIFVEDPRFLYKWMEVSNSTPMLMISSQTWKNFIIFLTFCPGSS